RRRPVGERSAALAEGTQEAEEIVDVDGAVAVEVGGAAVGLLDEGDVVPVDLALTAAEGEEDDVAADGGAGDVVALDGEGELAPLAAGGVVEEEDVARAADAGAGG